MTFEELVASFQALSVRLEQVERAASRANAERDEFKRERDEFKGERGECRKLYELVSLELERTRRHLFGRKAESVDPAQTQLAFLLAVSVKKDVASCG